MISALWTWKYYLYSLISLYANYLVCSLFLSSQDSFLEYVYLQNLFLCNQSCRILISCFSIETTVFQPCGKLVFQKCGRRKKFLVWGGFFFSNKFPYRQSLFFLFPFSFFPPCRVVFDALSWGRCLVFKYILVVNFQTKIIPQNVSATMSNGTNASGPGLQVLNPCSGKTCVIYTCNFGGNSVWD